MVKVKQRLAAALVFLLILGMFSGTAFGASARYAVVTEAVGNAAVMKAGGSLEVPVTAGMELHEGDRLKVGKGGSLTLKIADREDEITLGENWHGTLSKLRGNDKGGTDTAIKTWAGSMYNNVQKLTGTDSTFKVETPAADMNVRGTHFMVCIDPRTGLPKMIVNAGRVEASDENSPPVTLLPGQQSTVFPGHDLAIGVEYIDPEDLVVEVDSSVIEKLLRNKWEIDKENEELMENLSSEAGAAENGSTLSLEEQEVLERYKRNVENMLTHILKNAVESGALDQTMLSDILDTVNVMIKDETRKFDLDRDIPEIDRTAGVNEEEAERRRQQREEARQNVQERREQKEQTRQEVNPELQERLQQRQNEQSQANQQAEEDKSREKLEQSREQLPEDKRKALEEQIQRSKEAARNQPGREPANSESSGSDSSSSPDNPISTSTTIELSENSIVYGQTFAITAEVKTPQSSSVPDGGKVDFKIGAAVIGSAVIADGKATLTVDQEKWTSPELSAIQIGTHQVSAKYVGSSQYGSSTSPSVDLAIAKAETIVELSIIPDSPEPGSELTIQVRVAVKEPGFGKPAGMITLYRLMNDEWEPAAEPAYLEAGKEFVTFQDPLTGATAGLNEVQYKAEFVSDDGKLASGTSEVKKVVFLPAEPVDLPPLVLVNKVIGDASEIDPNAFKILVDLARFTVNHAVYGAELHFQHSTEITPMDGYVFYNRDKFDRENEPDPVEHIAVSEQMIEGQYVLKTIYTLQLDGREHGVDFSELDNMAEILFLFDPLPETTIGADEVVVELVYWKFTGKDGEPIEVDMQAGANIVINQPE